MKVTARADTYIKSTPKITAGTFFRKVNKGDAVELLTGGPIFHGPVLVKTSDNAEGYANGEDFDVLFPGN